MNTWRVPGFIAMALIQLAVPAWMIVRQERTLQQGRAFKLHTAPVDPYDAVRGRYVALRFTAEEVPFTAEVEDGQRVFIALKEDWDGYARVEKLSAHRLRGDNVFRAKVQWKSAGKTQLAFPFERYYLEEKAAPRAEAAYRTANTRDNQTAHVTIRVREGYAALEELFIANKPIRDYLRAETPAPK